MERKIALIPAYEPDEKLISLLKELKEQNFACVVVDDGSSPMCADVFAEAGRYAYVLHHPRNRGKGAALKTGMDYIWQRYMSRDVVVTVDADGQHTVADADRVAEAVWQNPDALVLGCRRFTGKVPLRSRLGNGITRVVYSVFSGQSVSDTQTGLRGFGVWRIPGMKEIPGERYEYEMNVLMAAAKQQVPITEVLIRTVYLDNNASSHFDTVRDSARIYKEILKFSAASFVSFLADYSIYTALLALLASYPLSAALVIANVTARAVSAALNFTINRRLVFESRTDVRLAAIRYAALAGTVLVANTGIIGLLTGVLGMNAMIAKLLAEGILFAVNFVIQRTAVFASGKKGKQTDADLVFFPAHRGTAA